MNKFRQFISCPTPYTRVTTGSVTLNSIARAGSIAFSKNCFASARLASCSCCLAAFTDPALWAEDDDFTNERTTDASTDEEGEKQGGEEEGKGKVGGIPEETVSEIVDRREIGEFDLALHGSRVPIGLSPNVRQCVLGYTASKPGSPKPADVSAPCNSAGSFLTAAMKEAS